MIASTLSAERRKRALYYGADSRHAAAAADHWQDGEQGEK